MVQSNKVTWYLKLLTLALFIALPLIGFLAGMEYQKAVNPSQRSATSSSKIENKHGILSINNDQLKIKVVADNGKLKYSGTVQMPAPCYNLTTEFLVAESYPEQVTLYLNTLPPRSGDTCAQVITPKDFSGELNVSEKASVKVILNGKDVN